MIRVPDSLGPQPLQEHRGGELLHQVHGHGIVLENNKHIRATLAAAQAAWRQFVTGLQVARFSEKPFRKFTGLEFQRQRK